MVSLLSQLIIALYNSLFIEDVEYTPGIYLLLSSFKSENMANIIANAALEDTAIIPYASVLLCMILMNSTSIVHQFGHLDACFRAIQNTDIISARVVLMKNINSFKSNHFNNLHVIVDLLKTNILQLMKECVVYLNHMTMYLNVIDNATKKAILIALSNHTWVNSVSESWSVISSIIGSLPKPDIIDVIQTSTWTSLLTSKLTSKHIEIIEYLTGDAFPLDLRTVVIKKLIDQGFYTFMVIPSWQSYQYDFLHLGRVMLRSSFTYFCDKYGGIQNILSTVANRLNYVNNLRSYLPYVTETFNYEYYNAWLKYLTDGGWVVNEPTDIKLYLNRSLDDASISDLVYINTSCPVLATMLTSFSATMINEYLIVKSKGASPDTFDNLKHHVVFRKGTPAQITRALWMLMNIYQYSTTKQIIDFSTCDHLIPHFIRYFKEDINSYKLVSWIKSAIRIITNTYFAKPTIDELIVQDIDIIIGLAITTSFAFIKEVKFDSMIKKIIVDPAKITTVRSAFQAILDDPAKSIGLNKSMKTFLNSIASSKTKADAAILKAADILTSLNPVAKEVVLTQADLDAAAAAADAAILETADILTSLNPVAKEVVLTQADLDAAAAAAAAAILEAADIDHLDDVIDLTQDDDIDLTQDDDIDVVKRRRMV